MRRGVASTEAARAGIAIATPAGPSLVRRHCSTLARGARRARLDQRHPVPAAHYVRQLPHRLAPRRGRFVAAGDPMEGFWKTVGLVVLVPVAILAVICAQHGGTCLVGPD